MKSKKLKRRMRVKLDYSEGYMEFVPGEVPYIWIGDDGPNGCWGSLNHKAKEKLKRMIDAL